MEVGDDSAEVAEIVDSGLVDAPWYLACHPDIGAASIDPATHFCRYGWRENRAPNAWFDPAWYLAENADVVSIGINPLLHYVRHGEVEGRRPTAHFDPAWYRIAHAVPAGASSLRHYLMHRTGGIFSPSALLYGTPYLSLYRQDLANGIDPYLHCVDDAARAGRDPAPDIALVEESGLLDPNYYLINGTDVREASLDPVEHFCRHGWRENRKPNIYFNTLWYLQTNPIGSRMQINPLVHYICEGEGAGRRPTPYFDPSWYRIAYATDLEATRFGPLAHYLAHRRCQRFSPNPHFDVAWYVERYRAEVGPNRDPFAHYLQMGTTSDLDPSPDFDAAGYRRRHLGRISRAFRQMLHPDRDNPLVHYLRREYH